MATATTNVVVQFGVPTADWGAITHWALNTAQTGGDRLVIGEFPNAVTMPVDGSDVEFAAGALTITVEHLIGTNVDGLTLEGAIEALEALTSGTKHISLHTSVPSDGNEQSGNGYGRASIVSGGWTRAA